MDAYSISYPSSALKNSTKIYQDLLSVRLHSTATAASTTFQSFIMGDAKAEDKELRVGIIGAGLAGLRCADILSRYGFRVTIIEGRDRIGGRMTQQRLANGHLVDLGPNWIHGTDDNPMMDLAKETGTSFGDWGAVSSVFDASGQLFEPGLGEKYSETMWEIVLDAFKYSNKNWTTIPVEDSLWDFFLRTVPEKIPDTEPDFEKKRQIVLQMAEVWGAFIGSPVTKQSLRWQWLEECIEGESLFCTGTYQKILETIAKPAKEKASILYNTRVTKIKAKTADRAKPTVELDSGKSLEFDEVVCTAPLGWLKQNLDAFEPALPERLQQGIRAMGFGCLEKVYISFPKSFWLESNESGHVVRGFCQWLSPGYAPDSNPKKWNQEIVELGSASTDGTTGHPTLLFYIYGEQSQYITEKVASLETQGERDKFLFDFFRPYYSRLPHYDPASPDCQPTGCLSTNWLRDDLAGNGSYTNFQVGLEHGDKDIRVMREGVPERGLWLAGEHTAPFVALGTATGAYWSGEAVARRIGEEHGRVMRPGDGGDSHNIST